jgi:hypothetical protein
VSTLPPPKPAPGWYPDPSGANTQRYFDGTKWTDQLAPFSGLPAPQPRAAARARRLFVYIAIGGAVGGFLSFILMQLAFGAAADGSLGFEVLGFALFVVFLVSVVATLVGIIGAIVRLLQQ